MNKGDKDISHTSTRTGDSYNKQTDRNDTLQKEDQYIKKVNTIQRLDPALLAEDRIGRI